MMMMTVTSTAMRAPVVSPVSVSALHTSFHQRPTTVTTVVAMASHGQRSQEGNDNKEEILGEDRFIHGRGGGGSGFH